MLPYLSVLKFILWMNKEIFILFPSQVQLIIVYSLILDICKEIEENLKFNLMIEEV